MALIAEQIDGLKACSILIKRNGAKGAEVYMNSTVLQTTTTVVTAEVDGKRFT